jgi:hypothetical protein
MGRTMRRWERELKKIPGVVSLETTSGCHIKLRLTNGRFAFTSSTPGDYRTIRNTVRQVNEQLRFGGMSANR